MDLSISDVRRLAVMSQGYGACTRRKKEVKEAVMKVIERQGYIQIDTISVVQRAHHHSLWNRERAYREPVLDELQEKDRLVFEYWGHAASYLPMADYRFYLPLMRRFVDPANKWFAARLERSREWLAPVMEIIRREGARSSRDFDSLGGRAGGWWDWKPAKAALEVLFWRGELMVSRREGFEKVYDLPERVIPDWVDTRFPGDAELNRFLARRAVRAHGLITVNDTARFLFGGEKDGLRLAMDELVEAGEALRCRFGPEGPGADLYADPDLLESLNGRKRRDRRVFLLSPFDNLLINRSRLRRLFDFEYTIECYVPEAKRRYGYFTLPILYGCTFIGRIDTQADRKNRRLIVRSLHFEEGFEKSEAFEHAFQESLREFAVFNGCDEVVSSPGINAPYGADFSSKGLRTVP